MAFNLQDMQKVSATCLGQNAAGNSAPIYGPVTWDNDNPIVVTITPVSDFQFYVESTGVLGSANLVVHGFADSGGTKAISGAITITVVAGQAVSILIQLGTPEPR